MRRILVALLLVISFGITAKRLFQRWQSERRHHIIALIVDWGEIRELVGRTGSLDGVVLDALKIQGATGVLIPPITLQDLLNQDRLRPKLSAEAASPFATTRLAFSDRFLAESIAQQLAWRGVRDVKVVSTAGGAELWRDGAGFYAVKDIDAGFDPALLTLLGQRALVPLLRVNNDPWIQSKDITAMLVKDPALAQSGAVLFNSDDVPGGLDAVPFWQSWMALESKWLPIFEFHPAKAAVILAQRLPRQSLRSHTIPSLELKDLHPDEVLARWNRAVTERTCRLLLVHASPSDSWPAFQDRLSTLRTTLLAHGWLIGWPSPESVEGPLHHTLADLSGLLATFIALVTPCWALLKGRQAGYGQRGFWVTALWTVAGASCVAALGWNAWTRLEIVPLRGIKAAFLLGWLGSVLVLYQPRELRMLLATAVLRRDLVVGAFVLAIVGYVMIRSGNASAGWRSPLEGGVRTFLERLLVARPRFKEFAIGHPLLLLGFWLERRRLAGGAAEGRFWILGGMMGQASIVNTFCHLHSPIALAFLRTAIGLGLGWAIGQVLITAVASIQKPIRA